MESSKIMMFPEMGTNNSLDPNLLLALNNNGGFGNNGNWIWILFLWLIWGCNGWGGNNGFGGGNGFLSNQINNDAGRELLMNAIQGNGQAIQSLASQLNCDINSVQNSIFNLNNAITSVGTQVGMSGLQILNAIQSGNASIASQICQCCCENRLAICEQTNSLQTQAASNHASDQLQFSQGLNTLTKQADYNTRDIVNAISAQSAMINDKFCDLEKRELQDKINSLTADNALLRSNSNNAAQTAFINEKFNNLATELASIKASQPNTVPVQWPNITAVNTTPQLGNVYGWNNGWGSNSFWN